MILLLCRRFVEILTSILAKCGTYAHEGKRKMRHILDVRSVAPFFAGVTAFLSFCSFYCVLFLCKSQSVAFLLQEYRRALHDVLAKCWRMGLLVKREKETLCALDICKAEDYIELLERLPELTHLTLGERAQALQVFFPSMHSIRSGMSYLIVQTSVRAV